jgi:hypothetical protein
MTSSIVKKGGKEKKMEEWLQKATSLGLQPNNSVILEFKFTLKREKQLNSLPQFCWQNDWTKFPTQRTKSMIGI